MSVISGLGLSAAWELSADDVQGMSTRVRQDRQFLGSMICLLDALDLAEGIRWIAIFTIQAAQGLKSAADLL